MTGLLTPTDLAAMRGVPRETIYRYLTAARTRARTGKPWPSDIPIPDPADAVPSGPRWRDTPELRAWASRGHAHRYQPITGQAGTP